MGFTRWIGRATWRAPVFRNATCRVPKRVALAARDGVTSRSDQAFLE
jgi:hypothetical protein